MTLIILYIKIKKDNKTEGPSLGSLVDPFLFSRAPALEVLRYHLSKTQLPQPLHPHKVHGYFAIFTSADIISGQSLGKAGGTRRCSFAFFKELFAMQNESKRARESSLFSVRCFSALTEKFKEQKFRGQSLDKRAAL